MSNKHAEQLMWTKEKLNKDHIIVFESMFMQDSGYKPHNFRLEQILQLIKKCGGSINNNGSSHFVINLPNTYRIWPTQQEQNNTLSYVNVPTAKGGSYRPHNTSDGWSFSAHKFCRAAFEKAGITMKRFQMAEQKLNEMAETLNSNDNNRPRAPICV